MKSLKQANLVVYTRKKTQYETTAGRGRAKAAGEKEKAPPPSIALERKQAKLLHQNKNRYQTTPGWGRHLRLGEKGPPKKVTFRQAIFGTAF